MRKLVDWIQPNTEKGAASYDPRVAPVDVLNALRGAPQTGVTDWSDLNVLDYRPRKGVIKARTPSELETQVDATTAEVIKTQQRYNDFANAWHDGSAWGLRTTVFLAAGLLVAYVWLSGFYLACTTTARKLRRSTLIAMAEKRSFTKMRSVYVKGTSKNHKKAIVKGFDR